MLLYWVEETIYRSTAEAQVSDDHNHSKTRPIYIHWLGTTAETELEVSESCTLARGIRL